MSRIVESDEIKAGWLRIVDHVKAMKRGEVITYSWIEHNSLVSGERMEDRVRGYLENERKIWTARSGEVIRLLTAEEQKNAGDAHWKRERRQAAKSFLTYKYTPRDELSSDASRAEVDSKVRHAAARLDMHDKQKKEEKVIMGAPDPRPELKSLKG